MTLNSLQYVVREAFSSMKRNLWLSLASVLTIIVSLVILGASVFFMVNASNMAVSFESELEIAVFAEDSLTKEKVEELVNQVENLNGVANVELVPKEEALEVFSNSIGSEDIVSDLGDPNPFPDKLTIHVTDAQQVKAIAQQIAQLEGVNKVNYGDTIVDKLLSFTDWLRWAGIIVVAAFTIASLILISLNIRMSVFSRRKEIQIMKLVGASNRFIRFPFLLEGLILGLVGAIVATFIVGYGYQWCVDYIHATLTFIPIVSESMQIKQILGLLILVGMCLGALGSAISLRKYLKV